MPNKNLYTKNPYDIQHVCAQGYHFERNGENLGRILWTKNVEGMTIEKDEE